MRYYSEFGQNYLAHSIFADSRFRAVTCEEDLQLNLLGSLSFALTSITD
jgi:hypothetical protein